MGSLMLHAHVSDDKGVSEQIGGKSYSMHTATAIPPDTVSLGTIQRLH